MANMFRCTLASGGALLLTVTSDSTFAGQTITCTDGTTTLTQICPSTSPYTVEFKIPNGGTWTISSGTVSTSVVIPDSIELHDIPNGSTITPINNIQIWLHCANIWNKSYTTINQVLSDTSTLLALISSNNAVDYMARSTNWATSVCANQTVMGYIGNNNYCANKLLDDSTWTTAICNSTYFESVLNVKVPTMTSNNTPSGEVISEYLNPVSGSESYKAFDGNSATYGAFGNQNINTYLGYKFTYPVKVRKIVLGNDYFNPPRMQKFKIQYSDNNSTWNDATNEQNFSNGMNIIANNKGSHSYWRYNVTSSDHPNRITTIQFYGRA